MSNAEHLDNPSVVPRSPDLMRPADTGLLVVDVQERLLPAITGHAELTWNVERLLDGARILGVRIGATEQYPEKLGPTVSQLAERLTEPAASKMAFSCGTCDEIFSSWKGQGIHRVAVCGMEAHVCVQQTVLDLLAAGMQVFVVVDAVGSRRSIDYDIALRRMELSGATLTTTEAVLFEWCGVSGTPEFKQISALVKQEFQG